jgi:hypothetical protein
MSECLNLERCPRNDVRVLFAVTSVQASVQFRQRTVSPAYSFTSVPSGPKRCPSAVQAAASKISPMYNFRFLPTRCPVDPEHPYLQTTGVQTNWFSDGRWLFHPIRQSERCPGSARRNVNIERNDFKE